MKLYKLSRFHSRLLLLVDIHTSFYLTNMSLSLLYKYGGMSSIGLPTYLVSC